MRFTKYIFDFDGTIMDTKDDVWVSIRYACARSGYELHDSFRSNPVNLSLDIREIFEIISSGKDPDGFEKFNSLLTHHYREINDFKYSCLYTQMEQLLSFLTETGRTRMREMGLLLLRRGRQGRFGPSAGHPGRGQEVLRPGAQ